MLKRNGGGMYTTANNNTQLPAFYDFSRKKNLDPLLLHGL